MMKQIDIACIIDDDHVFTYVLSKQMKLVNFSNSTMIFHNGLEALKYLKPILESPEALPSVILLDLNMPVLDGWQFLDEFTKLTPQKKITVYIVSSSIDAADHARALKYKAVSNFYIKPVTEKDLRQILAELVLD
jgi:CheY-like chemotaxis protein